MKNTMPKKLLDYINLVPDARNYIISDNLSITYGEIKEKVKNFSLLYGHIKESRCAIISDSRLSLSIYLPCVEYLASSIFLQPDGLASHVIESFYDDAQIDFVITLENNKVNIRQLEKYENIERNNQDSYWLLATSGTTGTPKLLSHSLSSLISTSKFDLKKGNNFIWGLCYDLNRFAGIQVYLQSISSGSPLVILEKDDSVNFLVKHFGLNKVNALSATPSLWRKILMSKDSNVLRFKRITLGGEIAEQSILDALTLKFPDSNIIHIYASTEAGVGFSVKDGLCGFPVSFINTKTDQPVKFKIVDERLWLKSKNAASSVLEGTIKIDTEGFIDTGDLVKVIEQRVFFLGRDSGSINVGGNKVLPEEVERVLNSSEHVLLSRVSGKRNSMLGMLVTGEVQLKETSEKIDKKSLKSLIINHCKGNLEKYKVPAMIKFVEKIPVNESGKIVRK